MKRLLFVLAILLISGQAFASNQKLVHGAGTLPHLNLTLSLELGYATPTPIGVALRIDMGIGNRVQLGISESMWVFFNGVEIHSLFNVLKTPNDSDFLSIYFNLGLTLNGWLFNTNRYYDGYSIRPGLAYEHRFGKERSMGVYGKAGISVFVVEEWDVNNEPNWVLDSDYIILEIRIGYQALLDKRFSVAFEPMLLIELSPVGVFPGGKASLGWTFDLKRIPELFQRRENKY